MEKRGISNKKKIGTSFFGIKNLEPKIFNKKAALILIWFVLLEVVILGIISVSFTGWLLSVREDTRLEKNYLKNELGLTATAANIGTGKLYYIYSLQGKTKLSDYDYEFKQNQLTVSDAGKSLKSTQSFMSIGNQLSYNLNKPNKIIFEKNQDETLIIRGG